MGHLIMIIILAVLVLFLLPTFAISLIIYTVLLVRTKPEKWGRECSIPDDEEYKRMFDIGIEWDEKYKSFKKPVSINSGKYRLFGEYFDFGHKKAVIIIAGRMESLLYSYFFAEPYRVSGYNVLVIDNRAHGLSDGKVTSLGFREYKDIIEWCRFLKELGNDSVTLHGICIGASCALFAATAEDAPEHIDALVVEGMYTTFYESFKNHMRDGGRPMFPFAIEVMLYIRIISGANVVTDGPIRRIDRLRKPILFLHSREDIFSLPAKAEQLYEKCNAKKRIEWFDKGEHSRIRINNMKQYDDAIIDFLRDI